MRIAALGCRSFYSLLRGSVSVQRWVHKAKEYGYGAIALTDVNSMYGVVDFCWSAGQADIRPILGVEILTDTQRAVLLAEDGAGYKNLCRITTARNLDPNFDLIRHLRNHSKGLICICDQQPLLRTLKRIFHKEDLFAGCHSLAETAWAAANKIKPLPYTHFDYLEEGDIAIIKLLDKIRQLSMAGPGPQDHNSLNPLISEELFKRKLSNHLGALRNAEQVIQRCNFYLLNGRYHL
ncbi:PHP domain-containing protein, partial [Planctomycetota bacterium]